MGAYEKNNSKLLGKSVSELPRILKFYENADFAQKQKVKFVYNLCILTIASILLIILYTGFIQTIGDNYQGLYLPVLVTEIALFGIMILSLILVIKGYYGIAIHTIFISTMATVWMVMWLDRSEAIGRLDTFVFILAILTMLPLLVKKYKTSALIYLSANFALFITFLLTNKTNLGLSNSSLVDFFADTTISLVGICIIGYNIYIINKRSIERIANDIEEKFKTDQRIQESDEAYRYMFEGNPQPMLIYKLDDLSILEVNSAAIKHYGYSKDEFLSFTLKDIRPKEDISVLLDEIKNINSTFSSKGYSRHLKKNGATIYAEISAHSITYKGYNARHVLINDITERIQTELALAESEKKFREMTNLLPQIVFEADKHGIITYANKKAYEQYGFTEEGFKKGINVFSTLIEADRFRASENINLTLSGLPVPGNQYTALRSDGTTFPVQIYSSAIKDNQSVVGLRGIVIDTTDRIKAEEEIKQSRDQFQSLVSNIPGITYRCLNDKEWTMLYISSEIDKISGYKSEDFINNKIRSYSSILHPDDLLTISKAVDEAISGSKSWEVEYRIMHKDGSIRWAYERGRAVLNSSSKTDYLDGFILDITERKKMDELLKESELRYKTLIETSQDGISLMDLNGTMLFVNTRKAEMVGASSETNLVGKNAFSLLTESSQKAITEIMPTLFQQGYMDNLEADVQRFDGTTFNAEFNVTVLKDDSGVPIYLMDTMRDITERKIFEEKLKQSEQFRRRVFDSSKIPIIVMDAITYQFIDINTAGINIYGFNSYNDALGKTPVDVSAVFQYDGTPSPQKATFYVEQALVNGSVTFEWLHRRNNGELWDAEVHLLCFQSDNKTLLQFSLIDITERKKAVNDLIESEVKYRTLFDNAQIGIYQTTPEGKILTANPALLDMLGFESIYELEKRNLETENVYIDSPREDFKKLIERDGIVKNFESHWLCKNGEIINIIENASAVRNINGKTLYYDGFVENITERKKAEIYLKESEEKYRTLMESMNEVVMMVDNEDRVHFVNNKFTEILGYSYDEIIGFIGYEKLLDPIDQETIKKANSQRKERISSQYEISFIAKNGRKIDFLVNGAPVVNSKGETIGSIGTMMDITEKKIIEKELEQYRNNLEILVKERTEELEASNEELTSTNEELYHQRKELETAMSNLKDAQDKLIQSEKMASLGVLAAGVAHEINNPLNFIYGGIAGIEGYINENLKDHIDEVAPLIEGIQVGVKRAADIVLSLNHYSRKDDLPSTVCNLHEVIDNCLVMLNNKIRNRIEVIKEFNAQPFTVFCNEGRLHQVFLNIIANSTQAIEDKGTISIFTKTNNKSIVIAISDTGCGIEKEILPKITDPFFTTKDPGKGTGLGLSITYNIIKEYNGTLEYESIFGIGTTATITLPIN